MLVSYYYWYYCATTTLITAVVVAVMRLQLWEDSDEVHYSEVRSARSSNEVLLRSTNEFIEGGPLMRFSKEVFR